MSDFDPSLYTRAPVFSVAGGITLARTLVEACPNDMPALVHTARDKLTQTADRAQAELAAQQRADSSDDDRRGVDRVTDTSWMGLEERLEAWTRLPAETYPNAVRAGELLDALFGTGPDRLSFLRESYPVQLATAETILGRIQEDGLQPDIDRLAGPEFLAHVRAMHVQYGRMVKDSLLATDDPDMRRPKRYLAQAIVRYAAAMCATVDEEEPDSADKARTALHAIVQMRADNARRTTSRADGREDDTDPPAPDGDPPPPAPAIGKPVPEPA